MWGRARMYVDFLKQLLCSFDLKIENIVRPRKRKHAFQKRCSFSCSVLLNEKVSKTTQRTGKHQLLIVGFTGEYCVSETPLPFLHETPVQ